MSKNIGIVKPQLQKIHIAKKQLNLDEETYRTMLESYGVTSSKHLLYWQAEDLLKKFEQAGWKPTGKVAPKGKEKAWGKNKYENLRRGDEYPEPKQLRMIEARYKDITGKDPSSGLNTFVKRITGKDHLEWIEISDVKKLMRAFDGWELSKRINKVKKNIKSSTERKLPGEPG